MLEYMVLHFNFRRSKERTRKSKWAVMDGGSNSDGGMDMGKRVSW